MTYGLTLTAKLSDACSTATGYATAKGLLSRFDKDEIVGHADSTGLVTVAMLETALDDGDLSSYDADEQAAVGVAKGILCRACADANAYVDGYVQQAGYVTPLTAGNPLLDNAACDLARYYLNDQGELAPEDMVIRRKKDAEAMLQLIGNGKISLGAQEKTEAADTKPYFESAPRRQFDRRSRSAW